MLAELIVFALVLVIFQTGAAVLLYHVAMQKFMSKDYIKKMTKTMMEVTQEVTDEMLDED